jgi:hypothetical protein
MRGCGASPRAESASCMRGPTACRACLSSRSATLRTSASSDRASGARGCTPHARRTCTVRARAPAPHLHRIRTAPAPHPHRTCTASAPHLHRIRTAPTPHPQVRAALPPARSVRCARRAARPGGAQVQRRPQGLLPAAPPARAGKATRNSTQPSLLGPTPSANQGPPMPLPPPPSQPPSPPPQALPCA